MACPISALQPQALLLLFFQASLRVSYITLAHTNATFKKHTYYKQFFPSQRAAILPLSCSCITFHVHLSYMDAVHAEEV